MNIQTSRFGSLEIDEAQLYYFPMGLLGFAKQRRYVIVDHEGTPFKWLQSVDEPQLAFVVTDPLFFKPDYHISLKRSEVQVIEPREEEDLVVSVLMTIPAEVREMSANLLAPLIFNLEKRLGMQLVLRDQRYPVKYYVLKEGQPGQSSEARSISLR